MISSGQEIMDEYFSRECVKDYLELLPLICNQATCFLKRIEKEEIKATGHEEIQG